MVDTDLPAAEPASIAQERTGLSSARTGRAPLAQHRLKAIIKNRGGRDQVFSLSDCLPNDIRRAYIETAAV